MQRRQFIRLGSGGLVWAAVAGISLAGCSAAPIPSGAVAAWQPPAQADLRHWLLAHALLAPNPHNMQPWLADHRLAGDAVLPAAAMLEMALAAGQARHPDAAALEVSEFHILRAILLEAERSCELRSRLDFGDGRRGQRADLRI